MPLELIDGLVAKELHAIAALNQRLSLGRQALKLDGADLGAVLLFLAAPLRLLIVVELALDALRGAMEQIDGRPEEVLEIRLHAGVARRHHEGIEDIGDENGDGAGLG